MIETSALISGCILWTSPDRDVSLKHKYYDKCAPLFRFLQDNGELGIGIITKTVEDEAKTALNKAVLRTIRATRCPDIEKKVRIMILQDIITNDCLDEMERIVEECTTRLPINIAERNRLVSEEIEPFLRQIVKNTVRYIQPHIPSFVRGTDLRGELTEKMVQSLPAKGVIYKGMPSPRDITIMAEATMIHRRYKGTEKVYVASMDNHFKPNPIQIGSFLSGYMKYLDEVDPTIRDKLMERFGFIGDEPDKIFDIIKEEYKI